MSAPINLVGAKISRLTVAELVGHTDRGDYMWRCVCECGESCVRSSSALLRVRRHGSHSGCATCKAACMSHGRRVHGGSLQNTEGRSRLWTLWARMRARCADTRNPMYGGKGVTVCPEWQDSFAAFREWAVANGYRDIEGVSRGDRLSIERIDPSLGYAPDNCEWIPMRENSRRAAIAVNERRFGQ